MKYLQYIYSFTYICHLYYPSKKDTIIKTYSDKFVSAVTLMGSYMNSFFITAFRYLGGDRDAMKDKLKRKETWCFVSTNSMPVII